MLAFIILLSLIHGHFCFTRSFPSTFTHFKAFTKSDPLFTNAIDIEDVKLKPTENLDIKWEAETFSTSNIMISEKTLNSYFSNPQLPFTLSASHVNITHISDNNYMSISPSINVFGNEFIPVLFYEVTQQPDNKFVSMKVTGSEMRGGTVASKISQYYSLTSCTEIYAKPAMDHVLSTELGPESYQVAARADIHVSIIFPKDKNKIPLRVLKSAGSYVLQNYLNMLGPNLLKNIVADIIKLQFNLTV